ncbi:hypothetical protein JW826_00005, partial [Candidatus Woesearchaeota archaeon]|nr:hypothetical protein [Candidatus Woesearchaeota archaeon]
PGFDIKDCKVTQGGLIISLYNGIGADVTSVNVTINATAGSAVSNCQNLSTIGFLANGQTSSVITLCGAQFTATPPSIGERFDGDISIVYLKSGESLTHTISGKVQRKVEQ